MRDLLFDTPYWILGALAIVGVALFIIGNNKTDAQMRNIGLGVIALAVVMLLVSWFVDTPEEKCLKRTKQLVQAVEKRDWEGFNQLVLPRCRLSILGAPGASFYRSRDEMLAGAKEGTERWDVKTARVYKSEVKNNVDYISVDIDVYSEQTQGYAATLLTSWQLDWQDTNDGWMCQEVIAKRIGSQGGEQLRRLFPAVGPQPARPPGWPAPGGGGWGQPR
jgi:hypothetical protein